MTRLWVRTPTIPSAPMSARLGRPVWLKLENTQPVGSFKQRGMGLSCARAVARGAEQLITSSGGNAGYAVAWAGRRLGVPVTVVVPSRTSPAMASARRPMPSTVATTSSSRRWRRPDTTTSAPRRASS